MEEQIQNQEQPTTGFMHLGIAPRLLEAIDKLGFTAPTPIQAKSIPVGIEGKDVIGIAQTGTGKTLAFGVPMIQRIARVGGRGLVVLPTRELALQANEMLLALAGASGLRTAVLIGGTGMEPQIVQLRRKPHVIVCTPGRLIDHLERKSADLSDVSVLVLDEADRMLDMGFMPQVRRILKVLKTDRQTMLFSATMPEDIVRIASQYMKTPVRVEVAPQGTVASRIDHELFVVRKDQKNRLLEKLLKEHRGSVLVFCRTRFGAKRINRQIKGMGETAAEIHSDRSLAQRREALDGFKSGKYRVLVATDIAARGIDVSGLELVINYDIPENPEDYIHRIGRTGRAGQAGRAISFAMPDQGDEVRQIEKLARVPLPISKLPDDLPPERAPELHVDEGGFGGRRFGGHGHGARRGGFGGARRQAHPRTHPRPAHEQRPSDRHASPHDDSGLGNYFGPGASGILGPAARSRRASRPRRFGRR